jgi:hypothetical protein
LHVILNVIKKKTIYIETLPDNVGELLLGMLGHAVHCSGDASVNEAVGVLVHLEAIQFLEQNSKRL